MGSVLFGGGCLVDLAGGTVADESVGQVGGGEVGVFGFEGFDVCSLKREERLPEGLARARECNSYQQSQRNAMEPGHRTVMKVSHLAA
ncbi:MAG: hypothetical protein FJW36_00150 [Acidobacteria bacterium]|nr:hypothetical protein [Acidobacteriota bacterium]